MSNEELVPLLVGEVFVDFTVTEPGAENKLRLGGVAHAARAFWSLNTPFRAAVILPDYLESATRKYFQALGCLDVFVIGYVRGAPNITAVFDATEVADQEYETLLRDEKVVDLSLPDLTGLPCEHILLFPGSFDLEKVCAALPSRASLHVDAAYDIEDPGVLTKIPQRVNTILFSTSSPLFKSLGDGDLQAAAQAFAACTPQAFILKENRGGARMTTAGRAEIEALPAHLGKTINSVGVGDVFGAAFVAHARLGCVEAAWRGTSAAAAYSQTTDPDLFKAYVQRDLKLSLDDLRHLGGVSLPWEQRRDYPIYLAAPDFSYVDRRAIDRAIASLTYHNFLLRRPVLENGELQSCSDPAILQQTYRADRELLKRCSLVFGIPTARDPGTLVEIGLALEADIPVVVYDTASENANTMVMGGVDHYSTELDDCLNAVFRILSRVSNS